MASPLSGQVALSSSPQALAASPVAAKAYVIVAPASNASPAYIGNSTVSTSTGFQLDPGDSMTYEQSISNAGVMFGLAVSDYYAVGSSGDKITWFGSP